MPAPTPFRISPRPVPTLALGMLLSLLDPGVDAQARELTETDIQRLETLSSIGQEACDAGRFEACHRSFAQAQELLPWAPHQFYMAEALVGMGKLVEGTELWTKILKDNDPDDPHPSVREAVRAARQRLKQVSPKIPSVTLHLPDTVENAVVRWNGSILSRTQLSTAFNVNPGQYSLEVQASGYRLLRQRHEIEAASHPTIEIELVPNVAEKPVSEPQGSWTRPWGIGLAAAGGISLGAGAVTWYSMRSRADSLREDCGDPADGACPTKLVSESDFRDRDQAIDDLNLIANALFVSGGVLIASGAGLLLWPQQGSGEERPNDVAQLQSWPLPGGGFIRYASSF